MKAENLYKLACFKAEELKDKYFPAKEGLYSARYINNHFYTEHVFMAQASTIIYDLRDYPQYELPEELKFKNLSPEQIEKGKLGILHYRLDNVISYLVKGWPLGDLNSDAQEYIKLYDKYYGDDKAGNN